MEKTNRENERGRSIARMNANETRFINIQLLTVTDFISLSRFTKENNMSIWKLCKITMQDQQNRTYICMNMTKKHKKKFAEKNIKTFRSSRHTMVYPLVFDCNVFKIRIVKLANQWPVSINVQTFLSCEQVPRTDLQEKSFEKIGGFT